MKTAGKKETSNFDAALAEAERGVRLGHGGPFGAAVVRNGRVIARAHNTVLRDNDPTDHAEMGAIRAAARRSKRPHLNDCVLIATSEPCPMCLAAAYWAGIREIHFCLPQGVAARFGFGDAFIYRDLRRSRRRRLVKEIAHERPKHEALRLFREWRQGGGRLY